MKLSLKATRLIIEALQHYRQSHDLQLQVEGLTEDERSDLINDRQYLEAIQHDLETYRDSLQGYDAIEATGRR